MHWVYSTFVVHERQLVLLLGQRLSLETWPAEVPKHLDSDSKKSERCKASYHYANDGGK